MSSAPPPKSKAVFSIGGHAFDAEPVAPGLYVIATPIGNLRDISLRALSTLAGADVIAAEDTRVTRVLLDRYGIDNALVPYHEHNAAEMRPRLLARLAAGEAVALVSDAGTPLVSDPGFRLVGEALEQGLPVTTLPGASAVLAALTLAGLPTDRFFFEGFLPPRSAARRARLTELAAVPGTLVLFESPHRIVEALADAAAVLPGREAAVARELTKRFETVRRGSLADLARGFAAEPQPKGEIVLLIGPPGADAPAEAFDLDAALRDALGRHSLKEAVARVAAETGQPRRVVYARALALRDRP